MTEQQRQEEHAAQELRISNRISHFFLGTIGVLSLLAAGALVAYNSNGDHNVMGSGASMPMAAAMGGAPAAKTVTVAMHDPGCHWFQVGSTYKRNMSVTGPVTLVNKDEAALKVTGAGGAKTDNVGQQVSLAPGTYRVTMVGQAPDDNTLHLNVS